MLQEDNDRFHPDKNFCASPALTLDFELKINFVFHKVKTCDSYSLYLFHKNTH